MMKLSLETKRELVRQVVRGACGWGALEKLGVRLDFSGSAITVSYSGDLVAVPDATDVAIGLCRYLYEPDMLQSWASIILGGSSIIDLAALESTETGNTLLEGLWQAAESGTVDPEIRQAALQLVKP
jgi:hypothetical protein